MPSRPVSSLAAVAAMMLLSTATACSGSTPTVPDYTATGGSGTAGSTSSSRGPGTTPPPSTTKPRPEPVPTTFGASQSAFTLPPATDNATTEMLRTYVMFEDAFRRSQLTTTLDPAVRTYAVGSALTSVTSTLTYLHDHGTTQQGPWRFHVTTARASDTIGVADVCISGGRYTEKGTTTPYTGTTSIRVTLNKASGRWLVTGYDQRKETCS